MYNQALLRITQRLAKVGGWAVTYGETVDVFWTPGIFEIYEYDGDTPPSLVDTLNCVHPDYLDETTRHMSNCEKKGIACEFDMEIVTFKGTPKILRIAMEPRLDEAGKVIGLVGACQDITQQVAEQHQNRLLSQRLLTTFEFMSDSFFLVDSQWRIVYANVAADHLAGRDRNASNGRVLWEEFPGLIDTPLYEGFHDAVRNNTHFHCEYYSIRLKNWIELDAYPSPEGLAVYFRTVTEQKLMAARIAASERRLKFVTQATLDAAWDWNLETDKVWWSGGLEQLFGFSASTDNDELETTREFWIDHIHPDERSKVLASIALVLNSESNVWEEKYRFKHENGSFVYVEHRGFLIRQEDGKPLQMVGGITDISERIEMAERLLQSQRLESIGKLTGHVAHDFNNLLTVILGNAELLQDFLQDNTDVAEMVGTISAAAVRGSELTRRLLAFARKQALDPKSVNIDQLVENMNGMLSRTLGVNIAVNVYTRVGLQLALVDSHQLEGALLNLSINARDAMPNGGKLTIETSTIHIDEHDASMYGEVAAGDYIVIAVTDTGTGIHPDNLKHVFEPFFTTKEVGKGTGLGLSSVFGFVKQSNGHVSIYSEPGSGTTVKLYLPVSRTQEDQLPSSSRRFVGGTETILVVEDDDLVRTVAQNLLEQTLGYRVYSVADGNAALAILEGDAVIDMMFSDVMMPGINGRELMQKARVLRPKLKVLLTSGFADNAIVTNGNLDVDVHLLPKPYPLNELARKVREILDR
ncbi:MAG: PAS domain-containing protein [Pseudomonadota bacterium]